MSAQFTIPLVTVIPGQLIASSLYNNEWNNLNTNFIPSGMDSYSTTDAQMQIQTAPYPGSVTSHASNLGGEIERIRYQISKIIGKTYWYEDATRATPTFSNVTVDDTTPAYILSISSVQKSQLTIDSNDTYIDFGGAIGRLFFRSGISGTNVITLNPTYLDMLTKKIANLLQGTTAGDAVAFPVTGSEMSNGTVTGTQIQSSVALPGSPTTTTQAENDSTTKVATTAFVNPANTLSNNGYQKLASGLIIQWGVSLVITHLTTITVTLPLAFPNNVWNVQATVRATNASPNNGSLAPQTGNYSLTQFDITNFDPDTDWDCFWFAVGN